MSSCGTCTHVFTPKNVFSFEFYIYVLWFAACTWGVFTWRPHPTYFYGNATATHKTQKQNSTAWLYHLKAYIVGRDVVATALSSSRLLRRLPATVVYGNPNRHQMLSNEVHRILGDHVSHKNRSPTIHDFSKIRLLSRRKGITGSDEIIPPLFSHKHTI